MSNECIQVVVRMRPFNTKEKTEGRGGIVDMDLALNQISIRNPENDEAPPKVFTFDSVYDGNTQQRAFYEESCFGLIESVLEGFNGTIFAYGQTGCGKTWTMQGPNQPPELRGVIPNSFSHIFDHVTASKDGTEYLVRCSYLEIYNEVIRDLLGDQKNPLKCDLKEDPQKGIVVSNLTDYVVNNENDMDTMLLRGLSNRTVGATLMNTESSRSHSIFTIIVEMNNRDANGKDHIRAGKLNLVDLAGSERQKKTGASGDRLKEGSKINLSLSALGNVISALSDGGGKHIPYRDSKLTRLLQDSLGGNTKTLMVAALSPADYNYDETLSTLRYANRAKSIKNKPKINEDPKDAMIREFKEEIERLRKILSEQGISLSNGTSIPMQPMLQAPNAIANAPKAVEDSPRSSPSTSSNAPLISAPAAPSMKPSPPPSDDSQGSTFQTTDLLPSMDSLSPQPSNDLPSAAPAAVTSTKKSSPRSNKSSPRSKTHIRSPRGEDASTCSEKAPAAASPGGGGGGGGAGQQTVIEKEYIEKIVEIEKIPEAHLHKQKQLEEYSQAVEEERDYFGEQLKEMENEVLNERNQREELTSRLQQLQQKLMGMTLNLEIINEGENTSVQSLPVAPPSAQKLQEQHDAQMRLNERKAKAKRKEEAKKKAEKDRLEKDSKEIDGELKQTLLAANDESLEKKITKIKKKFEKKLQAARSEIDDLHEEFELEREEMLETIREANKEAELFKQICCCLLPDEKKLKQILDRCQYDESNSQWILPVIKPVRDSDFRLPDIDSRPGGGGGEEYSSRGQSATRRPQSGQNILPKRPSSRSSRDDEAVREKQKFSSNSNSSNGRVSGGEDPLKIPSLNVPSYAPAKPPMPRSARKDKKKTKSSSNNTPTPTGYEPDEYGTGEDAGSTSEWGFAVSETLVKESNPNIREVNSDGEYDSSSLVLNRVGGGGEDHGDRQSSRHGSRREKTRSRSGTRRNNGGSVSDSSVNDKSFNSSCSPRALEKLHLPQL